MFKLLLFVVCLFLSLLILKALNNDINYYVNDYGKNHLIIKSSLLLININKFNLDKGINNLTFLISSPNEDTVLEGILSQSFEQLILISLLFTFLILFYHIFELYLLYNYRFNKDNFNLPHILPFVMNRHLSFLKESSLNFESYDYLKNYIFKHIIIYFIIFIVYLILFIYIYPNNALPEKLAKAFKPIVDVQSEL